MPTEPVGAHAFLMTWLSPSFPVGGFSYSHAIEAFVAAGLVKDATSTALYVRTVLSEGAGWSDAVLLAAAWRAASGTGGGPGIAEVQELASALRGSRELALETTAQGDAFLRTIDAAWPELNVARRGHRLDRPLAYPVAVALAAAAAGIPLRSTLAAYLHAQAASLISAAIRLIPLGQTDGQRAMAASLPLIGHLAVQAEASSIGELGGTAVAVDIFSMQHETQYTRLFRS